MAQVNNDYPDFVEKYLNSKIKAKARGIHHFYKKKIDDLTKYYEKSIAETNSNFNILIRDEKRIRAILIERAKVEARNEAKREFLERQRQEVIHTVQPEKELREEIQPEKELREKVQPEKELREEIQPEKELRKKVQPLKELREKLQPDCEWKKVPSKKDKHEKAQYKKRTTWITTY
jgi:hypothetical protein